MVTKQINSPSLPLKDRVGPKLAPLFASAFAIVFFGGAAYSVFSAITESRAAEADLVVQPAVVVIDPKIQSDLSKAIAFDVMPNEVVVQDPFVDRSGISSPALQNSIGATRVSAGTTGPVGSATLAGRATNGTVTTIVSGSSPTAVAQVDARTRYRNWTDRQNAGEYAGPESEALGIDDLVPVGFVSGGDGNPEVMLYSLALCKTFSFPAGTKFANGWMSSISQQEVVFTIERSIRRKSFARPEPCAVDEKTVGANSSGTGNPAAAGQ